MDLKEKGRRFLTGCTRYRIGTVGSSCGHGNESSGSIKGVDFLYQLSCY
jgi:hypothetical protein